MAALWERKHHRQDRKDGRPPHRPAVADADREPPRAAPPGDRVGTPGGARADEAEREPLRPDPSAERERLGSHSSAEPERVGPDPSVERDEPDRPTEMPKRAWGKVLKGTFKEFGDDELGDRAAALTYYGILALFPALLVLTSLLGLAGPSTAQRALEQLEQLAPASAREVIADAVQQLQGRSGVGSVVAVVGLVLAVWSASGYVGAFIRAANAVYDMPEGRPVWVVLPVRLGVTVVLMVMAVASALIVVFTGGVARRAGDVLGLGDTALTVWSIAKWPVLVLLVTSMIALLYWATPNAKGRGFKWITPGSLLALLIWLAASVGFAVYVANFASYNKTYGTLAGVVVFLVWLWITNLAILLGLEFDAEMSRRRAIMGGHPADEEPYVRPRDTRAWSREERERAEHHPEPGDGPDGHAEDARV